MNYSNLKEAILYYGFNKKELNLTWEDIADILNDVFNEHLNWDSTRQRFNSYKKDYPVVEESDDELMDALVELKKERTKLSDVQTQINADIRRMSREETLKEIALTAAGQLNERFNLAPKCRYISGTKKVHNSAVLQISDWHYGIDIDNFWNVFSPEIAKERISKLRDEVIKIISKEEVSDLYIVNLGDLIAGRIHLPLRLNSRIDTVTQTIQVSELLAQLLAELSVYVKNLYYYSTTDNHSRVEPIKDNSLDLESFSRFTDWWLKERLKECTNIIFNDNMYGDDIVTFNIYDYKFVAVHGDKDKPAKVVHNMTAMTQKHYDMILTAHLHHFSGNEENESILLSNGSLMGTDDYAEKLRLSSRPSQNMFIVSQNNIMYPLYRIVLD